jgi:hypothetical protein
VFGARQTKLVATATWLIVTSAAHLFPEDRSR